MKRYFRTIQSVLDSRWGNFQYAGTPALQKTDRVLQSSKLGDCILYHLPPLFCQIQLHALIDSRRRLFYGLRSYKHITRFIRQNVGNHFIIIRQTIDIPLYFCKLLGAFFG